MNENYKKILVLFTEWLNAQECYTSQTKQRYTRLIRNFLTYLTAFNVSSLKDADKGMILKFITIREGKKYALEYARLRESTLELFYRWANKYRLCSTNPVIDYRKAKLHLKPFPKKIIKQQNNSTTVLTLEEQKQLLACSADNAFQASRNHCLIDLILSAALYVEEVTRLTLKDLNLAEGCIYIRGKKNNHRKVELGTPSKLICQEWLEHRDKALQGRKCQSLLLTNSFKPLTVQQTLYRIIAKVMLDAGISKSEIGPEVLRQTAIYNLVIAGKTIEEIKAISGIKTQTNIEKYYKISENK